MSLARDVIHQLRAALAATAGARDGTTRAREQAAELQLEIQAATDGSTHEKTDEAIVRLAQAQVKLDEALEKFQEGDAAVEEYIAELEGGGSGGSPPPTGGPRPTGGQPEPERRRGIPGFTYRKPAAEAVEAIRREGWPTNADGQVSARGHLYDERGVAVNDQVIRPHVKGEAPPCNELQEPWRSDPDLTTTWHAERDAAKLMRDKQMRHAVMYLNIPPCGRESSDPQRCDANIEKILPRDAELYVWTIHENGTKARRRYLGNGDAIT